MPTTESGNLSGLLYLPDFISEAQEADLIRTIETLPFERFKFASTSAIDGCARSVSNMISRARHSNRHSRSRNSSTIFAAARLHWRASIGKNLSRNKFWNTRRALVSDGTETNPS
jgi:hypothetical protein